MTHGEGNQLHAESADIWFFDHQQTAGFQNAKHLMRAFGLIHYVMKRVHHHDAFEGIIGEGQCLGVAMMEFQTFHIIVLLTAKINGA